MVVEGIAAVALAAMVIAGLMQIAYGGVYLVLGNDAADKRKGARRLAMGGLLVLLFVLLFSLPACGPIDGNSAALPAAGMFDNPTIPYLWQGADHPEWATCRYEPPSALCTEAPKP